MHVTGRVLVLVLVLVLMVVLVLVLMFVVARHGPPPLAAC